jgi:DNA-binding MarR family transcriptional regulator
MHAVAFSLKRAHLRSIHVTQQCVRRFGITPARYDMLYAIFNGDAARQCDLWRLFHVSRTTVSRMLGSLEELGLVRRSPPGGSASRLVYLTDEGRDLMVVAIRGCHRPLCLLFEKFYPRTRRRLDRACKVMQLNDEVRMVAVGFGDRSRFLYPFSHPDDIYGSLEPKRRRLLVPVMGAGQARQTTMEPTH